MWTESVVLHHRDPAFVVLSDVDRGELPFRQLRTAFNFTIKTKMVNSQEPKQKKNNQEHTEVSTMACVGTIAITQSREQTA